MTTTQQKIKDFLNTKQSQLMPFEALQTDATLVTEKEFEKLKSHLSLAKESKLNVILIREKESNIIKQIFIKN